MSEVIDSIANEQAAVPIPPAGDLAARNKLVESLLPLVRHVVSRVAIYLPCHITKDDLVSAGVIGLIDAVNRFDPSKGASLTSYCHLRIRGSVLDELRRLDWVPRSVHEDAKILSEAQETLAQKLGREPDEEELRQHMGLDANSFADLVERVRPMSFFSLQEPAHNDDSGEPLLHEEVLADPNAKTALHVLLEEEDRVILVEQLKDLPKQQLIVLSLYYLEGLRLKEIAEVMDLTESRVSQIHALGISRLRRTLERLRKR